MRRATRIVSAAWRSAKQNSAIATSLAKAIPTLLLIVVAMYLGALPAALLGDSLYDVNPYPPALPGGALPSACCGGGTATWPQNPPTTSAVWTGPDVGWFFTPSITSVNNVKNIQTVFGSVPFGAGSVQLVVYAGFDPTYRKNGLPVPCASQPDCRILVQGAAFTAKPNEYSGPSLSAPLNLVAGTKYFIGFHGVAGFGTNITNSANAVPLEQWFHGVGDLTFAQGPGKSAPILRFVPACYFEGGDRDGDGLCDDWETNGLWVNGVYVNLPAMGADPDHKDIFVQADYMKSAGAYCIPFVGVCLFGHSHKPMLLAIDIVTRAFENSGLPNPKGGTGVRLHVDCGPDCVMDPRNGTKWGSYSLAHAFADRPVLGTMVNGDLDWSVSFDPLKNQSFTPTGRAPAFHYVIFAHCIPPRWSGLSRDIPTSDFVVSLGGFYVNAADGRASQDSCNDSRVGTVNQQAGTFMHELGHNLGLTHSGLEPADDEAIGGNYAPNFLSIMNYLFQFPGLIVGGNDYTYDYSKSKVPNLDEAHLNEPTGVVGAPGNYGTRYYCPDFLTNLITRRINTANGPIDWDCDGVANKLDFAADTIDRDIGDPNHILTGNEDWHRLRFSGGAISQRGLGAGLPSGARDGEMTALLARENLSPVQVTVASPGLTQVLPGEEIDLTFTVSNVGTQSDSYTLTATSDVGWGNLASIPGTVTLNALASIQLTIHVSVPSATPSGAEGHFTLQATSLTVPAAQDAGEAEIDVVKRLVYQYDFFAPGTNTVVASFRFPGFVRDASPASIPISGFSGFLPPSPASLNPCDLTSNSSAELDCRGTALHGGVFQFIFNYGAFAGKLGPFEGSGYLAPDKTTPGLGYVRLQNGRITVISQP